MNGAQLLQPLTNPAPQVEFELAYYVLPWDDRMRSTFDHDRFPIRETYPTFEEAQDRANESELDRFFDLIISEVDPELGYIASWEVQS